MAKTMSVKEGVLRHPEITFRPVSTRDWQQRFQPDPLASLEALLIKLGPFKPDRDAFKFDNGFTITSEQVEMIRQRYALRLDEAFGRSPLTWVRDVLDSLKVHIPLLGTVGLPGWIVDAVIGDVRAELFRLAGAIFDSWNRDFGRCGGMAFSGYDFYLLGWTIDASVTTPPQTGVLGDYIFDRLLDSLELNAATFLEWFANLHWMPHASTVANATLGSLVGGLGGPIGVAFGALLGSHVHVFNLGGPKSLLKPSKEAWTRLKITLNREAAWPVGLLFEESSTPIHDHQVLALSYVDNGNDTGILTVWDNREGPHPRDLYLDFTGNELIVKNDYGHKEIKGIIREEYSPRRPPDSLHLP